MISSLWIYLLHSLHMHITCRVLGFKHHFLPLNWRCQWIEYRPIWGPQWAKYYLSTTTAKLYFYFDGEKFMLSLLTTKERFKTPNPQRKLSEESSGKSKHICDFSSGPASLFSIDNQRMNNGEWEIILYPHLDLQSFLSRVFIFNFTM